MKKENNQELQVHIGESIDDMGRRFVDAWHHAERGELTPDRTERHVGFETFETFVRTMTPKRLELLRHVHRHPAPGILALAAALGRDYRRVHADVEALAGAGLLDRDDHGLHADYRTVKMETTIVM
jgi:predicted transcriptional regulator